MDKAEREHAEKAEAIQSELELLEKKSQAEDARWNKEKERWEAALRRAGLARWGYFDDLDTVAVELDFVSPDDAREVRFVSEPVNPLRH